MAVKPLGQSRNGIDESAVAEVVSLIPAIQKVGNDALRESVVLTWACSWKDSDYESLRDVLQGEGATKLLRHVNAVNDQVGYLVGLAEGTYGLQVDHDVALAAAILHDVDKPLLWTNDSDDKVIFRPGRSLRDHGILGAELAELCGVPQQVRDIVRGHSMYSDLMEDRRSPEAVVVHHADGLAGNLGALSVGVIPGCGRTMSVPAPF
ncbi:HDIG domain-containing metalloprotein [Kribbella lupini]|uniref:HD domain-containing protein n=1 Tax=Kribbella lupini TaxID=291602 RepID=A0ABN2CNR7_9ACTN